MYCQNAACDRCQRRRPKKTVQGRLWVASSCWGNLSGYNPMRWTDGEWNSKLARGAFDRHNTRTPYGKHILQHTQSARGYLAHSPQRTRCLYNVQIILPTSQTGSSPSNPTDTGFLWRGLCLFAPPGESGLRGGWFIKGKSMDSLHGDGWILKGGFETVSRN